MKGKSDFFHWPEHLKSPELANKGDASPKSWNGLFTLINGGF